MANLNDGVLDDLDDNVDDNIIVPPDLTPGKANVDNVTITLPNEDNKVTPLSEEQQKLLLDKNVEFKAVKDGIATVDSLNNIDNALNQQNAVSIEDAKFISEKVPTLLTDRIGLESFTSFKSKTNLSHTQITVKRAISKEEVEVIGKFNILIDRIKESLNVKTEDIKEEVSELLEDISNKAKAILTEKDNKNLIVPHQVTVKTDTETTVNTVYTSYLSITVDSDIECKTTQSAFRSISKLLESSDVRSFFLAGLNDKDMSYAISPNPLIDYGTASPSILDVIKCFANDNTLKIYEDLYEYIESLTDKLKDVSEHTTENPDYSEVQKVMSDNDDLIQDYINNITYFVTVSISLSNFITQVNKLISVTKCVIDGKYNQ